MSKKNFLGVAVLAVAIGLTFGLSGCSGRTRTQTQVGSTPIIPAPAPVPVNVPPASQNPFDSTSLNSGLFDRSTGADAKPLVAPQTSPPIYRESDLACLSRDYGMFGYQNPSGYQGGFYGGFASAVNAEPFVQSYGGQSFPGATSGAVVEPTAIGCLQPGAPVFGRDLFLDEALTSMGGMRQCFEFVASREPTANSSAAALSAHFDGAKRALVRCYRLVLARQVQIAQWSNPSVDRFNQVDANLYFLLNRFSQQ